MNGERGRHECAWPNAASPARTACHLFQHEKKQQHRYRMQEHISEVMTAGLESEQLAVEHVRNRRQRMPVSCVSMGKCADEAIGREALCDPRVFVHVHVIIEVDEIVPKSLTENNARKHRETDANAGNYPVAARFGESN